MGVELYNELFHNKLTFRVMSTEKCGDEPYEFIDNVGIEMYNEEFPTGSLLSNEPVCNHKLVGNIIVESVNSYSLLMLYCLYFRLYI